MRHTVFILFFFSQLVAFGQGEKRDSLLLPSFTNEKWTISTGLSSEFAGLGLKTTYYFNSKWGAFAGWSYFTLLGPSVGIEYKFLENETKRINPFIQVAYGIYSGLDFSAVSPDRTLIGEDETIFYGPSLAGGIKYKMHEISKYYLTLGLHFRPKPPRFQIWIDDFNSRFDVKASFPWFYFVPSLTVVRILK